MVQAAERCQAANTYGAGNEFSIGISIASVTHLAPGATESLFEATAEVATAIDQAGADLLAVPDHVMQMKIGGGADAPMLEAYTLLGALAATTSRTRLGAFVTPASMRNPALLAKSVTTVDVVSAGRAVLGIGAGVNAEEHLAYGIEFPAIGTRMARLEETLAICSKMFSQRMTTFQGEHFGVTDARNIPTPVQVRLPILIGGGGEKFTLPLVARFADVSNLPPAADDAELRAKLETIDALCEKNDRDPREIHRTAFLMQPESVDALRKRAAELMALGFQGVIIAAATATPDLVTSWIEAIRSDFG
ncbi:TIGR03560 family F420-dependent LLM class oxidoreductase [Aeromicrobium panaciterrae]|uniref:TIGR03560 family F420-dependent LLM class oxidoreductase n=1 Tax=Aeromicrobium panaciterrae TaxID=363861 RepID=UPI0031D0C965